MTASRDYINLLPGEEARRPAAGKKGPGMGVTLVLVFVLAWAGAFGWQVKRALELRQQLTSLGWKRQALAQQLDTVYKDLGITYQPGAETSPERAALIRGLLGERVLWSEVFRQFSRLVPKGLWFDTLEGSVTGKAEIRIKGAALNYLSIAEFMLAMEKSAYFERPQLVYAQKSVVQGQDVVGFEIVSGIKRREGAQ